MTASPMRFLDTNVLVRFLTGEPPDQYPHAVSLIEAIETGSLRVVTFSPVIFETIFVVHRGYDTTIEEIRDTLLPIIELPNLRLADKVLYSRAFDMCVHLNIPFVDAFTAVHMQEQGITEIYSWDRHFDRVEGITRIEPGSADPE